MLFYIDNICRTYNLLKLFCLHFFQVPAYSRDQVIIDIRQFYTQYAHEHAITGRAIARIFHGIASPCFPAITWGRVRRYWRSHLNVDFNEIMKLATQELVRMRCWLHHKENSDTVLNFIWHLANTEEYESHI